MNNMKIGLTLISIVALGALVWGGIAQVNWTHKEFDLKTAYSDLDIAYNQLYTSQNDLVDIENELQIALASLVDAHIEIDGILADLQLTQDELSNIKTKYPPKDFSSINELQVWVNAHVQPESEYADGTYSSALYIAEQGLMDGYIMFVNIQYGTYGYVVTVEAFVNGYQYYWSPYKTDIHQEYYFCHR